MFTRPLLAALLPVMLVAGTPLLGAEGKMSDDEINRTLVGTWITPLDSVDRTDENGRSRETFRADGTYTLALYNDPDCTQLAEEITVNWHVENGVLISEVGSGATRRVITRDEIVSFEKNKLTLHSLDDGVTYSRIKSTVCQPAGKQT